MPVPSPSAVRALAIALALSGATASAAPAATVVHQWNADGTYADAVGSATLTPAGNTTFGVGHTGQAFQFDGDGDVATFPEDASVQPAGSFTIDAWIATTVGTGAQAAMTLYQCGNDCFPNASSASYWQLGITGGQAFGSLRDAGGSAGQTVKGGPSIADGTFHHVAFMRDTAAGRAVTFVDGVAVADEPLTPDADGPLQNLEGENDPVTIGAMQEGGTTTWISGLAGRVDEPRYWDGAQSFDTTPPAPLAELAGPQGLAGWFTGDVQVTWDLREPSVIRSSTGCDAQTLTAESGGTTVTCSATSAGGEGTGEATVRIDRTAPTLTCAAAPTFAQGASGNVTATVSDALSGPAAASVSAVADTGSPGARSARLTATDVAGNGASADCPYTVSAPPAPQAATKPVAVPVTRLVSGLPPAPKGNACLSRRSFTIKLREQPGAKLLSATVQLGSRKLKVVRRAGRLTSFVDLRGLKPGRYTLTITAKLSDGRAVVGSRRYRTCAKKGGGLKIRV